MNVHKIEKPAFLSTLWIFILFNMILRDLHQFANKEFVQQLLIQDIEEELVLLFGVIIEIPILMVVLSRVFRPKANKWANVIAAVIFLAGLLSTLSSADMDDIFFMIMESAAILIIILIAWKLPSEEQSPKQSGI